MRLSRCRRTRGCDAGSHSKWERKKEGRIERVSSVFMSSRTESSRVVNESLAVGIRSSDGRVKEGREHHVRRTDEKLEAKHIYHHHHRTSQPTDSVAFLSIYAAVIRVSLFLESWLESSPLLSRGVLLKNGGLGRGGTHTSYIHTPLAMARSLARSLASPPVTRPVGCFRSLTPSVATHWSTVQLVDAAQLDSAGVVAAGASRDDAVGSL